MNHYLHHSTARDMSLPLSSFMQCQTGTQDLWYFVESIPASFKRDVPIEVEFVTFSLHPFLSIYSCKWRLSMAIMKLTQQL